MCRLSLLSVVAGCTEVILAVLLLAGGAPAASWLQLAHVDSLLRSGGNTGANLSGAVIKAALSLALILAMVYGVVWVLRRFLRHRVAADDRGAAIEILESAYLGPKKSLVLVRALDRLMLVGVCEQSISTVAEFTDDGEAVLKRLSEKPGADDRWSLARSFGQALKRARSRGDG